MTPRPDDYKARIDANAQNSEMIRASAQPQRIVLWILVLLGLLVVSGVAMTRWKEQRVRNALATAGPGCLCDTSFVEMCKSEAPADGKTREPVLRRELVPTRCDCAEESDAEKLRARGWRACGGSHGGP